MVLGDFSLDSVWCDIADCAVLLSSPAFLPLLIFVLPAGERRTVGRSPIRHFLLLPWTANRGYAAVLPVTLLATSLLCQLALICAAPLPRHVYSTTTTAPIYATAATTMFPPTTFQQLCLLPLQRITVPCLPDTTHPIERCQHDVDFRYCRLTQLPAHHLFAAQGFLFALPRFL